MSIMTPRRIEYGPRRSSNNDIICTVCKEITPKSISYTCCLMCFSAAHHSCLLKSESSLAFSLSYACPRCKYGQRKKTRKVPIDDPNAPSSPANDIVKQLLGLGASPAVLDYSLELPIHKAIRANNIPVIKTLINHSQGLQNCGLYKQRTILHHAAKYGSLEVVKLLVNSGCGVNVRDCIQETPIFMAASRGSVPIMKYLFQEGANISAVAFDKRTLLHRTTWHGHLEATRWLLENGLSPNCQNSHRWTPLHSAAQNGDVEIADLLIKYGANISTICDASRTPLQIAKHFKQEAMIKFLREKRAQLKK